MTTIILCGGSGTRLWPLSRAAKPKQFAHIMPGGSLFEGAVKRNRELGSGFVVAANAGQSSLAAAQLEGLGVHNYGSMVEPLGRNTAPAIALACMMVDPEEVVLAVPSDHLIPGQAAYAKAVHRAVELAKTGKMVTFGITPGYAETGYGYIETNGETVVSFKEKPDAATAERYVASSRYLWNSGMFCFKAGTFLSELHAYAPEVHRAVVAAYEKAPTKVPLAPAMADMEAIPSISVDYAVMEKSRLVACVACPPEMGWSDLGSYDALYDELCGQKTGAPNVSPGKPEAARVDTAANVSLGLPQAVHVDARGNLIISSGKRIVLVDVADLVVVDTPDALLVARRGSTQKVKDAVDVLKQTDPGLL